PRYLLGKYLFFIYVLKPLESCDMADLLHIEEASAKSSPLKASLQDFLELGFRPLYLCGATWAVVAVALWVFAPQWLQGSLSGVFWHAHEMLWGFVGAVAVGFL